MARNLTTAVKSAAAAGTVYPALLAHLDFSGGIVRVWSGVGDLSWGGNTYTGVGDLGGISPVQETNEPRANGLSLSLNGVPSAMVTRVLAENYRGRACKIWLALFSGLASASPIADPILLFSGRMDQCLIDDNGDTATITVQAESRLVDLQRPRERRYTDEDQQNLFPGDRGLEYVAGLQNKELLWGGGGGSTAGTGGGLGNAAPAISGGGGVSGQDTAGPGGGWASYYER